MMHQSPTPTQLTHKVIETYTIPDAGRDDPGPVRYVELRDNGAEQQVYFEGVSIPLSACIKAVRDFEEFTAGRTPSNMGDEVYLLTSYVDGPDELSLNNPLKTSFIVYFGKEEFQLFLNDFVEAVEQFKAKLGIRD